MRTLLRPPNPRLVASTLVLATLILRLPFISRFDLVSFDGTYYINQAKALLHGSLSGGAFPIGYPLLIAPVLAVARDGVLAAAIVSLFAAVGSVLILYALSRRHVPPPYAFAAAFMLAATPIFIDASLATLSESAYVFWVLLSLWFFDARRMARSGLSMGMAAATRPEALAIAAALGLLRVRSPRNAATFLLAFLVVYGMSVAALSVSHGRLTLLSRAGSYKSLSTFWALRESWVEYPGKEKLERRVEERAAPFERGRSYFRRLPHEAGRLGRHALPAIPGLVLCFILRRRERDDEPISGTPWFVLAALAPLPIIPLFTEDRGVVRWLVPYVAPMILFAVIGLALVQSRRARVLAGVVTAGLLVASMAVNQAVIGRDIESDMKKTRDAARRFAPRVQPGDAMADRKPYFAFYSGAHYVEIPNGPYDDVMSYLASSSVRYLSLHPKTVLILRPAMRPLVYDRAAIRGEMRYRQVQFESTGEIVYERVGERNPLTERRLTTPEIADHSPAWSPDGAVIAFRRHFHNGGGAIMLVDSSGTELRELVRTDPIMDGMAWSSDGAQIAYTAFAAGRMVINIYDIAAARTTRIASGVSQEWNPSWCRRSGEFVWCSDEHGGPAVYETRAPGRKGTQVSFEEPADFASVSPSGAWISWIDPAGHLVLRNLRTGEAKKVRDPLEILSAAAWSPDEAQVLVEAFDWGAPNVYMVDVASGRSLRLTSSDTGEGMPAWSPGGDDAVVVSGYEGKPALWMHSHLRAYVKQLNAPDGGQSFERPKVTRTPAPPGARRFRD